MYLIFNKTFNCFRLQAAFVVIFLTTLSLAAQDTQAQKVVWKNIGDKNNEFIISFPNGYEYFDDGQFYLVNKGISVAIKNRKTIIRYINGAVLRLDIYEGKIENIQKYIADGLKGKLVVEKTINGFGMKSYAANLTDFACDQQHFFDEDSLYVVSAYYRNERNDIVDNFFKSVRLFQNKKGVAPNFPSAATKAEIIAPLPDINEESFSDKIEEKPDKPAIYIYMPQVLRITEFGRSNMGIAKFNLLLTASGKVSKVKTIFTPTIGMADGIRPSAEHAVFLPALKDGKPVTTWQTLDYGFQVSNF